MQREGFLGICGGSPSPAAQAGASSGGVKLVERAPSVASRRGRSNAVLCIFSWFWGILGFFFSAKKKKKKKNVRFRQKRSEVK